jgi:hypothetical protein
VESVNNDVKYSILQAKKVENPVDKRGKRAKNKNVLWKDSPQSKLKKDMICMKKFLAISSVFLMMACALTGCGADRDNSRNDGSYYDRHDYDMTDGDTVKEHAHDAVDGAKDAGKDIVGGAKDAADDILDGAGNAANDVIDGLDGDMSGTSTTATRTTRTTTR